MSQEQQKRGKQEKGSDGVEKVIVAVKASKEIPKTALVWSLSHVVQPGDCITLLVVVPSQSSGRRLWGFPRFAGDCASGIKKYPPGTISEQKSDITDSCSQMILQLHNVYDPNKINVRIKIVSGSPCGAVAAEAKKAQANWVVLDKQLKHEEKRCMEELQCNIVVMKRSQPKVLRLNLIGPQKKEVEEAGPSPSEQDDMPENRTKIKLDSLNSIKGPAVTPTSSPELGTPFTATEAGTSSVSSSDPGTSPFFISEMNGEFKKEETIKESQELVDTNSDTESESLSTSSASMRYQPWITELLLHQPSTQCNEERSEMSHGMPQASTTRAFLEKYSRLDRGAGFEISTYRNDMDFSGNLREAIALSGNAPPGPPPLCSICQHKAPVFGKPPRWFSYAELELATGGFSQANFLAEGGFGSVHRGVLPEGQVIAVKQHKLASSQGDLEFCSEARPLLEEDAIEELIDPRLGNHYSEHEVYCMLHAASLCIQRDPQCRPRMSQVLRILEGDMVMDSNYISTPGYDAGNRSGRLWSEPLQRQHHYSGPLLEESLESFSGKLSLDKYKPSYWGDRDKARRASCVDDI
ncbi:hypothetical protein JHK82_021834 [Glycine max]|nr:hypothetical protein JHK82_021834 [Glycine max]